MRPRPRVALVVEGVEEGGREDREARAQRAARPQAPPPRARTAKASRRSGWSWYLASRGKTTVLVSRVATWVATRAKVMPMLYRPSSPRVSRRPSTTRSRLEARKVTRVLAKTQRPNFSNSRAASRSQPSRSRGPSLIQRMTQDQPAPALLGQAAGHDGPHAAADGKGPPDGDGQRHELWDQRASAVSLRMAIFLFSV
jgi:hypothetical protein